MFERFDAICSRVNNKNSPRVVSRPVSANSSQSMFPPDQAQDAKEEASSLTNTQNIVPQNQLLPIDQMLRNNQLFVAVEYRDLAYVNFLIRSGADVNACNEKGTPVLILALRKNFTELANALINASGANLDFKDNNGKTALIWAAWRGHNDNLQKLIYKKANLDLQDNWGCTALMSASCNGHKDNVKGLIDAKANLDLQDKTSGWTALHLAVHMGRIDIVQMLMDAGANLYLKDKKAQTAFMLARLGPQHAATTEEIQKEIAKLLKAKMDENIKRAFLLGLHARFGANSSIRRAWTAQLSETRLLPVIFQFAAYAEQTEDDKT